MKNKTLMELGNNVDQLITVNVNARVDPVGGLFKAARDKVDKPLTYLAAEALTNKVRSGDTVILATGMALRGWVIPNMGESDGPPGAAVLARAVSTGLKAIPVLLSEKGIMSLVDATCREAGLPIVGLQEARKSRESKVFVPTAVIDSYPIDDEEAKEKAGKLLDELNPAALISVERAGMNEKGIYHNLQPIGTFDITPWTAKIDYLFKEAESRGILTIGIGDAGNELGMANIKDFIRAKVPFGSDCKCPCKAGMAPAVGADHLVVADCSNWGAYGIAACLAGFLENPDVLHDARIEKQILVACNSAGGYTPAMGGKWGPLEVIGGADGLSNLTHSALVRILRVMVKSHIREGTR
jgi:hypothetical protein